MGHGKFFSDSWPTLALALAGLVGRGNFAISSHPKHHCEGNHMAEEMITITTAQPLEAVIKQVEDSLCQMGQASITKKGVINLNLKSKYTNFLSIADAIEGTIRQKREGQFDVVLNFNTKPTVMCWVIGIIGGLSLFLPAAVFAVPFYTARKSLCDNLKRALQQAQSELE